MTKLAQIIKVNGEAFDKENLIKLFYPKEPKDSWRNAIYSFLENWFDETDYILAQTSGSTGKPKKIQLPKQSMINSALMTNDFFGLNETKTALLCLPASYIAGKMMLVRALVGGLDLICVEPKSNPFENIDTDIYFAAITPFQLSHSLETIRQKNISNIIVGGGQVNTALEYKIQNIPTHFFETYGMTETCSHIALRQLNGEGKSDFFTVLNGISIRFDERNCLAIKAPQLLKNEITTNDIVEIKDEINFRWLGRYDSIINSGGIKIQPEQIEKKLEQTIQHRFFISSVPNHSLGNKVVLIIESKAFEKKFELILITKMKEVLDKYEIPTLIFYLENFIYSNDKVLKKETLEQASKNHY